MQQSDSGVLIYALNVEQMAAFYAAVLAADVLHADADHQVLQTGQTQLIVHAIPAQYREQNSDTSAHAERIAIPRSEQAIKPFFRVEHLAAALARVLEHGGQVLGQPYSAPNLTVQNIADTEGNIIHLRERI